MINWQLDVDLGKFNDWRRQWIREIQQLRKALFTPATMSKQHCRMLKVEQFFRQSRTLFRHFAAFDNNVERLCREISSLQQSRNKLKMFNFVEKKRNFTKNSFDIVAKSGNDVESTLGFGEATFDFCRKNRSTCSIRQRCCWCGRGLIDATWMRCAAVPCRAVRCRTVMIFVVHEHL